MPVLEIRASAAGAPWPRSPAAGAETLHPLAAGQGLGWPGRAVPAALCLSLNAGKGGKAPQRASALRFSSLSI